MVQPKKQMTSKAELFVVQKGGSVEKKEMILNFPCKVKGKLYIVTSQDCVSYLLPKSETQQNNDMDPRGAVGFQYGMSSKVCGATSVSEVRLLLSPCEIHRLNSSFNIIGFYRALTDYEEDLESLFNTKRTKKLEPLVPDKLINLASQFLCSSDADQIRRFSDKLNQRFTDKVTEPCLNVEDRAKALVFGVLLTLVAAEEGTFINASRKIQDKIEEINIPGDSDYDEQFKQMVTTFQMKAELLTVPHQRRKVFILFRNPTPETWGAGGVTDLDCGAQHTYGLCHKLFSVSGPSWEVQFLQNLQETYDMTSIFHLSGFAHHLLMDPHWRENLASLQKKESRAEAISKLCDLAVRFLRDEKYRHTFTKHFQGEIGERCSNEFSLDGCGEILLGMLVAVKAALTAKDINDGKIRVCDEQLGVGVHSAQQQTVGQGEEKKRSEKMTPPGVKQADITCVQDVTDTADAKEVTPLPETIAEDSSQLKADDPSTEPKADNHPPPKPKADDPPPKPKADDPSTEPKADDPSTEVKADDPPPKPKADDPPPKPKADDPSTEPKADDPSTEPKADDPSTEPKADNPSTEPKADDPSTEPKADDPPPEPKADDPPPKPKADDPSTEPKADDPPPAKPKADDPSTEPKADDPSTEPKADDPPAKPKADDPSTEPKADDPSTEPKADDPSTEPKADDPPAKPKADDPSTEPKADNPSTEPKADDPSTEPKADNPSTEPKADNPPPETKADDPSTEPKADNPSTEPKADNPSTEPKADDPPPETKADDPPPEPKADDTSTEPKADDPPPKPKADDPSTEPNADDRPPEPKEDETSAEPREDDPSEPKLDELPPEANSAPNVEDTSPTPDVDNVSSGPHLDDHSHGPKTVNATSAPKNIDPAPVPVADEASPSVEANGDELKRNVAVLRENEDSAMENASAPGNCRTAVPIAGDVGVKEHTQRIPFASQARNVKTEDSADRKHVENIQRML